MLSNLSGFLFPVLGTVLETVLILIFIPHIQILLVGWGLIICIIVYRKSSLFKTEWMRILIFIFCSAVFISTLFIASFIYILWNE